MYILNQNCLQTKFYHLEIGEDLKPRIDSVYAGSYVKEFSPVEPHDEFLSINTVWDGTEFKNIRKGMPFQTTIKFDTKEAALDAYKKLKSTTNDIDKAAELTKMFEQRAVKREAESSAAYKEKINVKNAVAKLMERFGGEAHIK